MAAIIMNGCRATTFRRSSTVAVMAPVEGRLEVLDKTLPVNLIIDSPTRRMRWRNYEYNPPSRPDGFDF